MLAGGLCIRSHVGGSCREASADLRHMGASVIHGLVVTFHSDIGADLEPGSRTILGQGPIDFAFNGRARSRERRLGLHAINTSFVVFIFTGSAL